MMEVEKESGLPFLDILIMKRQGGTLGHTVFRKFTHSNIYLNSLSHHHPAQKRSVMSTLIHRTKKIADADHLKGEMEILRKAFIHNGYGSKIVHRVLS